MARRLSDTVTHLEDLSCLAVRARLAKRLLVLANRFGETADDGIGLAVHLSQRELAELVGATRQTINMLLREWAEKGTIRIAGRRVHILDLERLAEEALPIFH